MSFSGVIIVVLILIYPGLLLMRIDPKKQLTAWGT